MTWAKSEADIRDAAEAYARAGHALTLKLLAKGYNWNGIYRELSASVRAKGYPPPDIIGGRTEQGASRRMASESWWRRTLRRTHLRAYEEEKRRAGAVSRTAGLYASDEAVKSRRRQRARNIETLAVMEAVNAWGQSLPLLEVVDKSQANPEKRRAELMTRIRGFEEYAQHMGHAMLFLTFTTPSRFHPRRVVGNRTFPNPKYDGATVRDAQAWLCKQWARIRAKLARHDLKLYGFRIAEPHQDGTPHWHLLVCCPRWAVRRVCRTARIALLSDDGNEAGAEEHRFVVVRIDPSKGTAAGYCAKYVAKNVDGFRVGDDEEAEPGTAASETASRVDAWAATHGIRQFQQIGGPSVGVYRELRRIDGESWGDVEAARLRADKGEWDLFMREQGGATVRRDAQKVQLLKQHRADLLDTVTGEIVVQVNRYGEPQEKRVIGVVAGLVAVCTRPVRWFLQFARSVAERARTCVNNCTREPGFAEAVAALPPPIPARLDAPPIGGPPIEAWETAGHPAWNDIRTEHDARQILDHDHEAAAERAARRVYEFEAAHAEELRRRRHAQAHAKHRFFQPT